MRSLYCLIWAATLKSEDHSGGLGGSQCRMGRVCTQGMVEDRGGARQQEPHGVGEKGRRRGPVTVEVLTALISFSQFPRAQ